MNENVDTPEVPNEPQELTTPTGERVPLSDAQRALVGKHWTQRLGAANAKPADKVEGDDEPKSDETPDGRTDGQQQEDESVDEGIEELVAEVPQPFVEAVTENLKDFSSAAQEIGVPADEFQMLVQDAIGFEVTNLSGVSLDDRDGCLGVLRHRLGADEAARVVKDAQAAVVRLGPKVADALDRTGYGNSPGVLQALARYYRNEYKMSVAKAEELLEDLRSSKVYQEDSPAGRAARDKARVLYNIVNKRGAKKEAGPKKSSEPSKPKVPAKSSAKQSQEAELKSLIAHPAYRDKSHREYGSVKARIEALYASIYPGNAGDDE